MKKFIILLLSLILSACVPMENTVNTVEGTLEVHYIDVGQADCSLVISENEAMLIDGGNADDSRLVVSYLKNLGIDKLDYLICTHAHEDHVGGLSAPLSTIKVSEVYAPKTEADSKAYSNFKKASIKNAGEIKNPVVGETLQLGESAVTFLAPIHENYEDVNDTSIVLRVDFGETSFLFTGDAQLDAEKDILESGAKLSATVLKVGHHGSSTSSSYRFLREVMPKFAVISCEKNNSYGHPHDEVISRLNDLEAEIYRTDEMGDIIAVSDGKEVKFETNKLKTSEKQGEYIGNMKSKKFHTNKCDALPKEENRIYFDSKEEALESGYTPCQNCN